MSSERRPVERQEPPAHVRQVARVRCLALRVRRRGDELADCGERLFWFIAPDAVSGIVEHNEARSGDSLSELLLVTDGDERIKLARQDQRWAVDASDLGEEIDPPNLISPEMDAHLSSRKIVRANTFASPLVGL
jgi:hypothetical protein